MKIEATRLLLDRKGEWQLWHGPRFSEDWLVGCWARVLGPQLGIPSPTAGSPAPVLIHLSPSALLPSPLPA